MESILLYLYLVHMVLTLSCLNMVNMVQTIMNLYLVQKVLKLPWLNWGNMVQTLLCLYLVPIAVALQGTYIHMQLTLSWLHVVHPGPVVHAPVSLLAAGIKGLRHSMTFTTQRCLNITMTCRTRMRLDM